MSLENRTRSETETPSNSSDSRVRPSELPDPPSERVGIAAADVVGMARSVSVGGGLSPSRTHAAPSMHAQRVVASRVSMADLVTAETNNGCEMDGQTFRLSSLSSSYTMSEPSAVGVVAAEMKASSVLPLVDSAPSAKQMIPAVGRKNPPTLPHETFYGFVKEPTDALLIVEGCIRGILISTDKTPIDLEEEIPIRSGSIVVFEESSKRWRDGRRWSPSRVHGPFLLYREVEPTSTGPEPRKSKPTHILDTRIPGLEPTYSCKTLKQNTRLVEEGLTKRTITLKGSDARRYRVISYYARQDVIDMYVSSSKNEMGLVVPSETPQLNALLRDPSLDMNALLAESIDLEKYASEVVLAKKNRKEDSIKAVAKYASEGTSSTARPPKRPRLGSNESGSAVGMSGNESAKIHGRGGSRSSSIETGLNSSSSPTRSQVHTYQSSTYTSSDIGPSQPQRHASHPVSPPQHSSKITDINNNKIDRPSQYPHYYPAAGTNAHVPHAPPTAAIAATASLVPSNYQSQWASTGPPHHALPPLHPTTTTTTNFAPSQPMYYYTHPVSVVPIMYPAPHGYSVLSPQTYPTPSQPYPGHPHALYAPPSRADMGFQQQQHPNQSFRSSAMYQQQLPNLSGSPPLAGPTSGPQMGPNGVPHGYESLSNQDTLQSLGQQHEHAGRNAAAPK
ncbi:Gti1/Pac2 family-domain-containing protein [Chytriomyces cf. hyalinus JEL632]|nr:Gti1/Pac2 family-domain-containing protein [Chytriomyces cf. hyalinus JEL632]